MDLSLTKRDRTETQLPASLQSWAALQRRNVPTETFTHQWAMMKPSTLVRRYSASLAETPDGQPTLTVSRAAIAYGNAAAAVVLVHLTAALTGLGIPMKDTETEYIVNQMLHNDRVRILALSTLLLWIARLGQGEVKLYAGSDIAPRHILTALHESLPMLRQHEQDERQRVRSEAKVRERERQQANAISWRDYAAARGLDPDKPPYHPEE